nr:NADH dehydrogenase subunit 2 [Kradibia gibbosae]
MYNIILLYKYMYMYMYMYIYNVYMYLMNLYKLLWMLMEINSISFLFMLFFDFYVKTYILMNYYLIQTFMSFIFLFSSMNLSYWNMLIYPLTLSLLVKMGMFPFHFWYVKIMKNLSWLSILILSTLQKIIPLMGMNWIININNNINMLIMIILLINMIWAAFTGLNQNSTKLIMTFSSIIHQSWLIWLLFMNELIMISYFIVYFLTSFNIMMLFNMLKFNNLMNSHMMKLMNPMKFYFIAMNFMILTGLPPFFSFLLKLIMIQEIYFMPINYLIIIIYSSLISLFFYLRILFPFILLHYQSKKINFKLINFKMKMNYKMITMNWILLMFMFSYEIF